MWLVFIFVLQILAHKCTKISDKSCVQYNVPNITSKVPGYLCAVYGQYFQPDYCDGNIDEVMIHCKCQRKHKHSVVGFVLLK